MTSINVENGIKISKEHSFKKYRRLYGLNKKASGPKIMMSLFICSCKCFYVSLLWLLLLLNFGLCFTPYSGCCCYLLGMLKGRCSSRCTESLCSPFCMEAGRVSPCRDADSPDTWKDIIDMLRHTVCFKLCRLRAKEPCCELALKLSDDRPLCQTLCG